MDFKQKYAFSYYETIYERLQLLTRDHNGCENLRSSVKEKKTFGGLLDRNINVIQKIVRACQIAGQQGSARLRNVCAATADRFWFSRCRHSPGRRSGLGWQRADCRKAGGLRLLTNFFSASGAHQQRR